MTDTASRAIDQGSSADAAPAALPAGIHVRHLRTHEDFLACVALQDETWGAGFSERVPMAILKVSQRIGGVTAGAFDATGRLVGFVFGMTGVERGRLVHWSDMLAVRPEWRDHGIGRRLKEFQRDTLVQRGVEVIYWTYDPLVARNAHLNFNQLGVQVVEYVIDMYGSDTDSALHRGIGSDRFVVAWHIGGQSSRATDASTADARAQSGSDVRTPDSAARDARVLNASDDRGVPTIPQLPQRPAESVLRVEIPLEIDRIQATSLRDAARWRATTRAAFTWVLQHSYAVTGFYRDAERGHAFYVLSRKPASTQPPPSTGAP